MMMVKNDLKAQVLEVFLLERYLIKYVYSL